MRTRVTIGDFSRASHLSVKTLRHYHEVGLLEPSEVDPDSGYRYYSEAQIPVAQVIRRLRGLQMPVGEVRAVLSSTDLQSRNQMIVAHLDRLEHDLARTADAVAELRGLLERSHTGGPVEHRTLPPTPAIGVRETIDRDDVFPWWQGAQGELQAIARAQGLERTGPVGGIYVSQLFQHGRGEATVFIPTDDAAHPVGRVESRRRKSAGNLPLRFRPRRIKENVGMTDFPKSHRDLLDAQVASLATIRQDGFPHVTEVWFLYDEGELKTSLNTVRLKTRNLQRDPKCSLFILDLQNPYRYLEVRGIAHIEPDDDLTFARRLGAKYDTEFWVHDGPGESRVVVTIEPVNMHAWPSAE